MSVQGEVTGLLSEMGRGDKGVVDRILPLVYDELHRVAHRQLLRMRPGQTLDTTGLVHEAYLKLVDQTRAAWNDRVHFLAVSAIAMRQILVDYSRRLASQKRGGHLFRLDVDDLPLGVDDKAGEILAIHEALTSLEKLDERLAKLVELRFFGGLTVEESAQVLEVSPRTVKRDWQKARALLYRALKG